MTLLDSTTTVDRAITVRQSWAFGIAAGFKPVENRGAMCNYLGTVALHTSQTMDPQATMPTAGAALALEQAATPGGHWYPANTPRDAHQHHDPRLALGAIIAVVDIIGCHRAAVVDQHGRVCCAPWGQATHRSPSGRLRQAVHLQVANPRVLAHPIPERGQPLLLWRLTPATSRALAAELHQPGKEQR